MNVREDLLKLTPDAVIALANRGLVKRALKEIAAGKLPDIDTLDDGTVVGRFDGDVETRIPTNTPLRDASCTCGARGMCRHRVALALSYGHVHGTTASGGDQGGDHIEGAPPSPAVPAFEAWSPAIFDDNALTALVGKRAMTRARSLRRKGFVAKVRRPTAENPVATVELSTSTVRFLVPRELAYAQTDSQEGTGHVFIALGVWAFQRADEVHPGEEVVEVEVAVEGTAGPTAAPGLGRALALADEVLLEGVVHGRPSQAAHFERVRRALDQAGLIWPSLCIDELEHQLIAYHGRSARYQMGTFADLVVELHARSRAARHGHGLPARSILGSNQALVTDMKHLSLVALGARVTGGERDRRADVFFVDSKTATTLVLRKEWTFADGEDVPNGDVLARRRVAAHATLGALAGGTIVSQAARRRANRLLELKTRRVGLGGTKVVPSENRWDELPEPLRVEDVAALLTDLAARPPRMLRPRVLASDLHVVALGEVGEVAYAPGEQHLSASVMDPKGHEFMLRLAHRRAAPGALDLLARVLSGSEGEPRYVSGTVHRSGGGLRVTPIAVLADKLHILDLAAEESPHPMEVDDGSASSDRTTTALRRAGDVLAEGAHRGLRHVSPTYSERVAAAAGHLSQVGLTKTADRIRAVAGAVRLAQANGEEAAEERAARTWVDALLRVRLCEEGI